MLTMQLLVASYTEQQRMNDPRQITGIHENFREYSDNMGDHGPDSTPGASTDDTTRKLHTYIQPCCSDVLHIGFASWLRSHALKRAGAALTSAATLVAAVGCAGASAASPEQKPSVQPIVHVNTQQVSSRPVQVWLPLTGQLKGSRETDLAANANGRVVKTLVERGDTVKAGQPLARLDTRAAALTLSEVRASAESAQAAAENDQTNCLRYQALFNKGAISQSEFDRSSVGCRTSALGVAAAQARAALAAQTLGDGIIRAPFSGSVAERFINVGEYVHADSKVATLVDLSTLRLELTIPEANIAAAKPGTAVRFAVAGYPDRQFSGVLKYIAANVRPTTRDLLAEAIVDIPDVALRPGMFAAVQLAAGTTPLPVIPRQSLIEKDGQTILFVDSQGHLEERIVQLGESLGEEVAILRGVEAGEKVVLAPSKQLKNGQRTN